LALYSKVIAPPSTPSCFLNGNDCIMFTYGSLDMSHPTYSHRPLAVSEAFTLSPLYPSIMKSAAAVCSQLLSRNDDTMVARPDAAWPCSQNQRSGSRLETLVVKHDIEEGAMRMQSAIPSQPAFVINKPQLAELIHKETDARASGTDHLSQRFLTDLRNKRLRLALLPKMG
jgi:hypothetical protein